MFIAIWPATIITVALVCHNHNHRVTLGDIYGDNSTWGQVVPNGDIRDVQKLACMRKSEYLNPVWFLNISSTDEHTVYVHLPELIDVLFVIYVAVTVQSVLL